MLAYAAHRRVHRQLSPATLIAIVGVHAVALTLVALAKMDVVRIPNVITTTYRVPPEIDPPPEQTVKPKPQPVTHPTESNIDRFKPIIPPPPSGGQTLDPGPIVVDPGPTIGLGTDTGAGPVLPPKPPTIVMPKPTAPVLATPADQLRPPYPEEKRRLEQEATLRLRLAIDPRGRVTAVDPDGPADPAFLASARSHLIRYWRYLPATEDGQPVATSIVVTLRFRLDDEG
ncbi:MULTISPECIES: energy transducer TonB [Sphingomonas]|uniref:energy transducer TonB n=1 Tax=Sphingomonas TaxID=13687 RepID=UPI000DEF51C0|nr:MULTISPECIES: energy transducer TonB [Sphingomonas]